LLVKPSILKIFSKKSKMRSKLKKSSKTERYVTLVFVLAGSNALAETAIMLASKTIQRTTAIIFFIFISPLNIFIIFMSKG